MKRRRVFAGHIEAVVVGELLPHGLPWVRGRSNRPGAEFMRIEAWGNVKEALKN